MNIAASARPDFNNAMMQVQALSTAAASSAAPRASNSANFRAGSLSDHHQHQQQDQHRLPQDPQQRRQQQQQQLLLRNRFVKLRALFLRQRQQHAQEMQSLREQLALPSAEFQENSEMILLKVDLPGVLSRNVRISIEDNNVLVIYAIREHKGMDGTTVVKRQPLQRRYAINEASVDASKLRATLTHGVLTLQAPKKARSLWRSEGSYIDVASNDSSDDGEDGEEDEQQGTIIRASQTIPQDSSSSE